MKMALHIISFDVPYPADYGGIIDVFNRLKTLYDAGFQITLHCFDYGRGRQPELEKYTHQVLYYKRKNKVLNLLKKEPMIVASRSAKKLLDNLLKDDAPILFEGQHTTGLLDHPALKNRKKLVRLHNVEHKYYKGLGEAAAVGFKKSYFKSEAKKLRKHEPLLLHADHLLCLHHDDVRYYKKQHNKVHYAPPVFELLPISAHAEKKDYILFHGNLSVLENSEAAEWIIQKIAPKITAPIYFAGKYPSDELKKAIQQLPNCKLIANPSENEMNKLLHEARAHLLLTFRPSGIKLKLLNALRTNAPVICNSMLVAGTGLEELCTIADSPNELIEALNNLEPLPKEMEENRKNALAQQFSPAHYVDLLKHLLQE